MTGTSGLILSMVRRMNKKIGKKCGYLCGGNNPEMLLPEPEVRCINRCSRTGGYLS